MRIAEHILEQAPLNYPIEKLCAPDQILFLDIETTGFTPASASLYLIGCVYHHQEKWHTIQWFAENPSQEAEILEAFFTFANSFRYLIHFNGNHFDLPFLTQKCVQSGLPYRFDAFEGLDLFRRISPYKDFLRLPNCKQKTIEQYLGIDREDLYTGGELIDIYRQYCNAPSPDSLELLLLHNREDIQAMLQILPMLAYHDLFHLPVTARKVQSNRYRDVNGGTRTELLIKLALPSSLPLPVDANAYGCYFKGEGQEGMLRVPVYEGELKYFYDNYKDYYYLPQEDMALHKSVATFVDKEYRTQATAKNCYTRKCSSYLRQWDACFTPFFKESYDQKELYFELTDERKQDRKAFSDYASHVLQMLARSVS